jgi:hypothetical protein
MREPNNSLLMYLPTRGLAKRRGRTFGGGDGDRKKRNNREKAESCVFGLKTGIVGLLRGKVG